MEVIAAGDWGDVTGVALDTNRLTDLFRGDRALATRLEHTPTVAIPLFVLGEIEAGFEGGSQPSGNHAQLDRILSRPNFTALLPDLNTSGYYARLFVQLKRSGSIIPTNDLWIAALALQHHLVLITRDRHFSRIPQLRTA